MKDLYCLSGDELINVVNEARKQLPEMVHNMWPSINTNQACINFIEEYFNVEEAETTQEAK